MSVILQRWSDSYGGAVWCASANSTKASVGSRIALGCEDGSVRLFRVLAGADAVDATAPDLVYERSLARQAGMSGRR